MLLQITPELLVEIIDLVASLYDTSMDYLDDSIIYYAPATPPLSPPLSLKLPQSSAHPPLKTLRLVCRYFAYSQRLLSHLFSTLRLYYDPRHVALLRASPPVFALPYVRTLDLYAPWAGWQDMELFQYNEVVRIARTQGDSIRCSPLGVKPHLWHAYEYSEKEIRDGYEAYQNYSREFLAFSKGEEASKVWGVFAGSLPALETLKITSCAMHRGRVQPGAVPLETLFFVPGSDDVLQELLEEFENEDERSQMLSDMTFQFGILLLIMPEAELLWKAVPSVLKSCRTKGFESFKVESEFCESQEIIDEVFQSILDDKPELTIKKFTFAPAWDLIMAKDVEYWALSHKREQFGELPIRILEKFSHQLRELELRQGYARASTIFPCNVADFSELRRLQLTYTTIHLESFLGFLESAHQLEDLECKFVVLEPNQIIGWKKVLYSIRDNRKRIKLEFSILEKENTWHSGYSSPAVAFKVDLRIVELDELTDMQRCRWAEETEWLKSKSTGEWEKQLSYFLMGQLDWTPWIDWWFNEKRKRRKRAFELKRIRGGSL